MIKPTIKLASRHDEVRFKSYIIGFVLSIIVTLLAYVFVVNHVWPKETLIYVVLALAIIQLTVQAVFFLHIGRGSHWKLVTFVFALMVVVIVVGGSLWIMNNLDYNMMHMTPEQMQLYMEQNEGI